jgi:hypothetical protein
MRVHQISEDEFNQLVNGAYGQINLNFALALLPSALTILVTLGTVSITDVRVLSTYWVAFGVFAVQGLYHLCRWYFTGGSIKRLVAAIRSRMPEQISGQAEVIPAGTTLSEPPPPSVAE